MPRARATGKLRLPANVVKCKSADGTMRYGAKVKFAWMKNQLRCGSNYVDPESASKAANLFQSASRDASNVAGKASVDAIVLDEATLQRAVGHVCNIYVKRSTATTQASVVDLVRNCVENVNAKLRRKARVPNSGAATKAAVAPPARSMGGGAAAPTVSTAMGALYSAAVKSAPLLSPGGTARAHAATAQGGAVATATAPNGWAAAPAEAAAAERGAMNASAAWLPPAAPAQRVTYERAPKRARPAPAPAAPAPAAAAPAPAAADAVIQTLTRNEGVFLFTVTF